ncbi:MAG: tetratricopeptide repeat protein [Myxococcales bacterium]|nr:tetratricopeptide repeat protein [Myxococcales bacterium]
MIRTIRALLLSGASVLAACGGAQKPVAPPVTAAPKVTIKPRDIVASANEKLQAGKAEEAIAELDTLIEKQPDNTVAIYNRGLAQHRLGNWQKAEADYRTVLAADPKDESAAVNLGAVLREQGKVDEAIKVYEAQLENDEFDGDLLNNLSVLYREKKDYERSIGAIRKLLMRDKNNVDAYKNLALVYFAQDKLRLSQTILENARSMAEEQGKKDPDIFVNLGMIYLGKNENGRAMAAFKRALELEPEHTEANYNIGALALSHRDYDLAAKSYEVVSKALPTSADVAASLGYAYQGQQKLEQAIGALERAWDLQKKAGKSSQDDQVLYQLTVIAQNAQQLDKAKGYAESYMQRNKLSCSAEDFEGFCGRYNGINMMIQMEKEATAPAPAAEEGTKATGRDIFTEEEGGEAEPAPAPEGEGGDGA